MVRGLTAVVFVGLFGVIASISACDSSQSDVDSRLVVLLTDVPFPFDDAAEAKATINRVELVRTNESNPVVLSNSPRRFNLLELQDGITAELASVTIPEGSYSKLRLVVAEEASVLMKSSREYEVRATSGGESIIEISFPELQMSAVNDRAEITVDFDVAKSFVVRGNPAQVVDIKGFDYDPVIEIVDFELNGTSVGLGRRNR